MLPLLGLWSASCSGLLDQKPYGQLIADQLQESDAEQMMTSAYAGLYAHYFNNNEAFSGPSTNWIFDVRSDDALKGGGATSMEGNIHQLEMSNLTSDNVSNLYKWKNDLYAIAYTNSAHAAMVESGNPEFNTGIAEMIFLRAFYYFDMLKIFQYIPYIDETVTDIASVRNDQYSQVEIYDILIGRLEKAYDDLPETQKAPGRATKYAAAALLAKMYAQRPGTTNWKKVEEWSGKVVGKFSLYDHCGDIAKIEFKNTKESIFAMQCSTGNSHAFVNWCNMLNCTYSDGNLYGNGDDFFLASQDLVNCFRTDPVTGLPILDDAARHALPNVTVSTDIPVDPRLDYTVGRVGMPWKAPDQLNQRYSDKWCRVKELYGEYSGKKFVEEPSKCGQEVPWGYSELNFIFLRYADILLLHAEALIELNTDLDVARQQINLVRQKAVRTLADEQSIMPIDLDSWMQFYRVGLYPETGWTQDYARKAVRMERRLELAMEGHRWFDLVRWGIAEQTMNTYFENERKVHSYIDKDANVTSDELYLPVPLEEITNSNGAYVATGKSN